MITDTIQPTLTATLSPVEIARSKIPPSLAYKVDEVIEDADGQILAVNENDYQIARFEDGEWVKELSNNPNFDQDADRELHRACRLYRGLQASDMMDSCDISSSMARPLRDSEVVQLSQDLRDGNLVEMHDGLVPMLDKRLDSEISSLGSGVIACTVRGWIPFEFRGAEPDTILVACELRLNANESQMVWIDVADSDMSIGVVWLEGGVLPDNLDEVPDTRAVPFRDLIELFKSGQMNGRQILFDYLHDPTYVDQETGTMPYRELREALERDEGIDLNGCPALFPQMFYFDDEVKDILPQLH